MLHNFMYCIVNQTGRYEKADSSPEDPAEAAVHKSGTAQTWSRM